MLLEPVVVRMRGAGDRWGCAVIARVMLWLGLPHWYLSTGCLHGGTGHAYCQTATGLSGAKTPAVCKFCRAPCRCRCHRVRRCSRRYPHPRHWFCDGWTAG